MFNECVQHECAKVLKSKNFTSHADFVIIKRKFTRVYFWETSWKCFKSFIKDVDTFLKCVFSFLNKSEIRDLVYKIVNITILQ